MSIAARVGTLLLAAVAAVALFGLIHTPYDPTATDLLDRFAAPSSVHWLGTDQYGADVLSRLLAGTFTTLCVSLLSSLLAVAAGSLFGAALGFFGGTTDRIGCMLLDALLAFPGLLLVLGIMAVVGPSTTAVIVALGIAFAPAVARVVRASVLSLREREFVEASRLIGNPEFTTLLRHVLPNCITPVLTLATSLFSFAVLAETALSFLGLGVPPPAPSLGGMLADSREYMDSAIWLALAPGITITVILLGVNLCGDALRDRWDPRIAGRS